MKALFDLMFISYHPDQVDETITRSGHFSYKWNDSYVATDWQAEGTLSNDQALGVVNLLSRRTNTKYLVECDLADALIAHAGNQTQTADYLGMNRGSLRKMIKRRDPASILIVNGVTYNKWECHNKRGVYPRGKKK